MAEVTRTWVPVPGWWFPIWVTLDATGHARDPLEDAVLGLVRAGMTGTGELAHALRVGSGLVESAVNHLTGSGVLEREDGSLKPVADPPDPMGQLEARRGLLAWDPAAGRPLLQLWLGAEPPEVDQAPPGWQLAPWEPRSDLSAPSDREVADALRLLSDVGELRAFEPVASGLREVDGARIHSLRRRGSRNRRLAPIWVPVEQRVPGPVVWRPALLPTQQVDTELSPGGWAGLLEVSSSEVRQLLDSERTACLASVAPGVLREAGFSSVEDLRRTAAATAARELGDLSDWERARRAAEDAFVVDRLGEAAGGDWRQRAGGWASLLDVTTHQLVRQMLHLRPAAWRTPDGDEEREGRRALGPLWQEVKGLLRKPDALRSIDKHITNDADGIGERLLWIGATIASSREARSAFTRVIAETPDLFEQLDKARQERNAVIHPRERVDPVPVAGFRARVLRVCRALISVRFA